MGKILSLVAILVLMVASTGFAKPPVTSVSVDCNWGKLTMEAAPLGRHASDPSGDGPGPEPRVGLANIVERGNLHAACEFIEGLLEATEAEAEPSTVTAMSVKCNWGKLTMEAVPLGEHASDPSGDGRGPEPRVGLANIVERGNLHAVCEFLSGQ